MILVYDMNGKLVFNKTLLANKGINTTVASISGLAAGNYMVKIKTGSKIMMEKINKF